VVDWERAIAPALLLVGGGLVAYSVLNGTAHLYLLVVIPVVSGGSVGFLLGVLMLALGILLLPWSLLGPAEATTSEPRARGPAGSAPGETSGGVILVGPIPFFFGSWRGPSRTRYLAAVAAGVVLLVVVVALFLVF
jgi:uncharacterized membrane protein